MTARHELLTSATLAIIERIASADKAVEIPTPLRGRDMDRKDYLAVLDFRRRIYDGIAPYLNQNPQKSLEERIGADELGYHLVARKEGRIVGTLRLNDDPFEIAAQNPAFARLCTALPGHIEMSRVVTDGSHPGTGKKLLIMAGLWVIRHTPFHGILGHCKAEKLGYFAKFGLRADTGEGHTIPGRGATPYYLIHAEFSGMIPAVLRDRLRKLFR